MDLTQAEAIADLIDASSEQAAKNALNSLQGVFSQKIHALVESLTHLRIYVEAAIDFPEEEVDFLSDTTISEGINTIFEAIHRVLAEAKQGAIIREGMTVVIAGRPNAGKSSLLNALHGMCCVSIFTSMVCHCILLIPRACAKAAIRSRKSVCSVPGARSKKPIVF